MAVIPMPKPQTGSSAGNLEKMPTVKPGGPARKFTPVRGNTPPVTRIPTPPPSGPIMGINPPGKAPIRKPSPPPPSMASNLNKISRGNSGSGTPSPQLRRAEAEKQKSNANNSIAGNLRNIPRGESSGSMSGNLNRAGNAAAKRRKAKQLALKKMAANRG